MKIFWYVPFIAEFRLARAYAKARISLPDLYPHTGYESVFTRGMSAFAGAHRVGRAGGSVAPYTNKFFLMISGSVWA